MKIVFVRIPKNASRSIKETNLFGRGPHETIDQIRSQGPYDISFCVCRNPYSRFLSAYKNGREQFESRSYPYFIEFRSYPTFESFCLDSSNPFLHKQVTRMGHDHKPKQRSKHVHFIPQHQWVAVRDKIEVDYVLRMETLEPDWEEFLLDIEIPHVDLDPINQSSHIEWQEYYTDQMAEVVYNYYWKDFIIFKYPKFSWSK